MGIKFKSSELSPVFTVREDDGVREILGIKVYNESASNNIYANRENNLNNSPFQQSEIVLFILFIIILIISIYILKKVLR
jgi:hypothetical protein